MRCAEFRSRLRDYLAGCLPEDIFALMVEHESSCVECHALASRMQAESAGPADAATREIVPAGSGGGFAAFDSRPPAPSWEAGQEPGLLDSVLARTTGADCRFVEQRMAEALDEDLPEDTANLVESHLRECTSCRQVQEGLSYLPDLYREQVWPRADRRFVREVLDRTLGPQPGFLDVVRALWRRPEAVWEAALVCTLLTALLLGGRLPDFGRMAQDSADRIQIEAGLNNLEHSVQQGLDQSRRRAGGAVDPAIQEIGSAWAAFQDRANRTADWAERVKDDLRTRDYPALLLEVRAVLEPLGILPSESSTVPEPGNETQKMETRGQTSGRREAGDGARNSSRSGRSADTGDVKASGS